jgi:hypothetical protein
MRSKVDEALDEVDQILDRVRPREEEPKSEWDIDTARHEVEELKKTVDRIDRVREPSGPHIIVLPKIPSSPPKHRPSIWLGIAAIITALGGAAGIQQCANSVKTHVH